MIGYYLTCRATIKVRIVLPHRKMFLNNQTVVSPEVFPRMFLLSSKTYLDQGDSEKGGSVFICDETDGFIAVVLHHFNGSGWGG